jgi:hypothetical protein
MAKRKSIKNTIDTTTKIQQPMAAENKPAPRTTIDTHLEGRTVELDRLVEEINSASLSQLDGMQDIARACAKADDLLPPADKKAFASRLNFEPSKFSKFVKMGRNEFMWKLGVKPYLPQTSFTTLYVIARMSDKQIDQAIANKVLHPAATREDLTAFLAAVKREDQDVEDQVEEEEEPKAIQIASIEMCHNMETEKLQKLEGALVALRTEYPEVKIALISRELAKETREYQKKNEKYVRREAKKLIAAELSKMGETKKKLEMKKRYDISEYTPLPEVQANLVALGLPQSIYPSLLLEAERKVKAPARVLRWVTVRNESFIASE